MRHKLKMNETCTERYNSIRVFHSLYKIGRNGIISIKRINNSKKKSYLQWVQWYNNAISANFVQTVKNTIKKIAVAFT